MRPGSTYREAQHTASAPPVCMVLAENGKAGPANTAKELELWIFESWGVMTEEETK